MFDAFNLNVSSLADSRNFEPSERRKVIQVAILRVLAQRDNEFCSKEKSFLYRYIVDSDTLSTDKKTELCLELNTPFKEDQINVIQKINNNLQFSDIFSNGLDASDFVLAMLRLTNVDDDIHRDEVTFIKQICDACKITKGQYSSLLN